MALGEAGLASRAARRAWKAERDSAGLKASREVDGRDCGAERPGRRNVLLLPSAPRAGDEGAEGVGVKAIGKDEAPCFATGEAEADRGDESGGGAVEEKAPMWRKRSRRGKLLCRLLLLLLLAAVARLGRMSDGRREVLSTTAAGCTLAGVGKTNVLSGCGRTSGAWKHGRSGSGDELSRRIWRGDGSCVLLAGAADGGGGEAAVSGSAVHNRSQTTLRELEAWA